MRNLKRALSLALASMMLIGMMVVSAGAASKDFTDKDEIKHPEAVNTMVALNVISGKEDGSYFDPTGTLTRAEMAKMVTYILNGGVEPVLGTKVTPTYSDIKGHWAEAYIEYCTSMNIIVGDGTGKFNPEGTLTASQCAKMLLTAMNYKDDVFGFVGNNWEINVNREANAAGLYKELGSISASAPISRDDAAQMVYNAIQAKTMKLTWQQDQTTGQITQSYTLTGNSLFEDKFGGERTVLTFAGDHHVNSSLKEGQISLTGKYTVGDTERNGAVATFDLGNDNAWIGEKVEVLWKDNTTKGTKNALDKEDTVYGIYPNGETSVLNVTSDDIDGKFDTKNGKIKVDGTEYEVVTPDNDTVVVTYNYGVKTDSTDKDATAAELAAIFKGLSHQNGDAVKFILNDENKVEKAYVQTYKLGTVTAVNSEKVTISGLGSIVIADNEIYDGIAKNDVVVYSKLYKADNDDAYVVVNKAETVSGTVDSYKNEDSVTVDGSVYNLYYNENDKADLASSVGGESGTTKFANTDIGETFTLYLVNGYVAGAVQTSESATNYSLVIDANDGTAGSSWNPLKLVVMAADGTKTTLTLDEDSDVNKDKVADTKADFPIGSIVTWTGSADDAKVDIEAKFVTSDSNNNYEKVTKDGVIYDDTSKTFNDVVTATDAVLFVTTDGDTSASNLNADRTFKAYNIRNLKDVKAVNGDTHTICVIDDGKVVAAFALLGNTPSGASGSAVYGIVTADNGTVKVDDKYYSQYVIASNEETYTVNVDGKLAKGTIYGFAPVSDNVYDADDFVTLSNKDLSEVIVDGSKYTADVVAVKDYSESDALLTYYTATKKADNDDSYVGDGSAVTKAVSDDVTIVYVDVDNDEAGDEIGINAFDSVTGYMNAIIVMDDNVITHIIVETSGEGNVYDINK